MTCYDIKNEKGETVAVMFKFDTGRCIVNYTQNIFDSIEECGQAINTKLSLHETEREVVT